MTMRQKSDDEGKKEQKIKDGQKSSYPPSPVGI
jgi:hypothetical protein